MFIVFSFIGDTIRRYVMLSVKSSTIILCRLFELPCKFAVEAGVINGWEKYIDNNNFIGMKSFGASGPYKDVYKHFNITAEHISERIKNKLTEK